MDGRKTRNEGLFSKVPERLAEEILVAVILPELVAVYVTMTSSRQGARSGSKQQSVQTVALLCLAQALFFCTVFFWGV